LDVELYFVRFCKYVRISDRLLCRPNRWGTRKEKNSQKTQKVSAERKNFSIDEDDDIFNVTTKFLPNGQVNNGNGNGNGNGRSTNENIWQLQYENVESVRKRSCNDLMRVGSLTPSQSQYDIAAPQRDVDKKIRLAENASAERVDKIAMILFPTTFTIFNIFYWWYYLTMANQHRFKYTPVDIEVEHIE